jgi:hypothetical protein
MLFAIVGLAAFAPQTARASWWCESLWFTRNAVLDRAGICFDSVLGQAIFDNTGCTGTSIALVPEFVQVVTYISELERREGCRIDTSRPVLNLPDLAIRRQLVEIPVPDENNGYNCIGWRGPSVALVTARSDQAAPVGRVDPGDFVGMWATPGAAWSYVVTSATPGGPMKSGGWMQGGWDPNQFCAEQAG